MRAVFLPFLVNGVSGDPALWVDVMDEGRSLLLDMGELWRMPPRKLLRIERALVSHTHMDHFVGFDHLLRLMLGREKPLTITGPAGFIDQVAGRLAGYCWNLIDNYPVRIVVEELDGPTVRTAAFCGSSRMTRVQHESRPFDGTIHAERAFTVHAAVLDHGIPVLAFSLRETEHLAVNKDELTRSGLKPGPWLRDLKHAARRCLPGDVPIEAETIDGGSRSLRRGALVERVLERRPGQRIGYVTDMAHTSGNIDRLLPLIADSDLLVCEAPFLHEDRAHAEERHHLTARQAGEIARRAGARRLAPFHFSSRYADREPELWEEVAAAFGGKVLQLPAPSISPATGPGKR